MNCPNCDELVADGSVRVLDSRPAGDGIRRRRACVRCGHRWSTLERYAAGTRVGGRLAGQPMVIVSEAALLAALADARHLAERLGRLRDEQPASDDPDDHGEPEGAD